MSKACNQCGDDGMYRGNRGEKEATPCNYCLPGKLQAELEAKDKEIFQYNEELSDALSKVSQLLERIEFAVEYLPESPDKAKAFLISALESGVKK